MAVVFLSPLGILLTLGVALPLVALVAVRRRAARVRRAVGAPAMTRSAVALPVAAAAALALFVGLAAAQPVVERQTVRNVRSDAEAYVVLDVSRSMLARQDKDGRTRLARAKAAALKLRAGLPTLPVGVATLTDRVLPHLFPSADEAVFRQTVERAVGIERPPPRSSFLTSATSLDALAFVSSQRYFSPSAKKRLLVVYTDGESQSVNVARIVRQLRRPPAVDVVFVQVWGEGERVYTRGVAEAQYRPDPAARLVLERLAAPLGGEVVEEDDPAAARREAARFVGDGPTVTEGERTSRYALAPYLLLVAFAPLGLLLWRRDR